MNVADKYPWTDYMLDIHHLLPLSSSVAITTKGTSLNDIVGLCPSCHRSIHIYYTKWLKYAGQDDFSSRAEAMDVYLTAIKEIA
jgi:predicted HNH restriction endonuclease